MADGGSHFTMEASHVDIDKLMEWVRAPINDDLEDVPGIGPAAARKLRENGVKTTTALVGRFLLCKTEPEMKGIVLAEAFYQYLRDLKIDAHRSKVVRCIAARANVMVPGVAREKDLEG